MDQIKTTLKQLWQGELSLAQTFWLYYVVAMIALRIVASAIGPVMGIVILGWAGFMVVPIWRSADNYTGNSLFALLAKIAAVLMALGVLGTLF